MRYLPIWRRILAILYDSFLIFALLIIMSMPFYSFNIEEDFALKSWGITIIDDKGNGISYKKAIIRFNMAIISFAIFGLGFLISILRKDRKCMHDIISKTYLIKL